MNQTSEKENSIQDHHVHVLNGDSLKASFPVDLPGDLVIMRECLIVGPTKASSLDEFYQLRTVFNENSTDEHASSYNHMVVDELDHLKHLNTGSIVYLWFEDDLFCQINMWFILYLLNQFGFNGNVYRVFPPTHPDLPWAGFGYLNAPAVAACFPSSIKFEQDDLALALSLWQAFSTHDVASLSKLQNHKSSVIRHLDLVIAAHLDRFSKNPRPEKRLKEILASGTKDFPTIFSAFKQTESIYGFGDTQVQNLLDNLLSK